MTKRQWFLVAGTLVLAACSGEQISGVCQNDEENGALACETPTFTDQISNPTASVGTDEP